MSADLITKIELHGTQEELFAFVSVLKNFEEQHLIFQDGSYTYINNSIVSGNDVEISLTGASDKVIKDFLEIAGPDVTVKAAGPWGEFEDPEDSQLYQELAKAAPTAEFKGLTSGFTAGEDNMLQAVLKNSKLYLRNIRIPDEDKGDIEEELTAILPYEDFCSLLHVNEEVIDEYDYAYYLREAVFSVTFPEMGYSSFTDLFREIQLDERDYEDAADKLKKTGILNVIEEYDFGSDSIYDPILKEYKD